MKESRYNLAIQDRERGYCLFNTRCGAAHVMTAREYASYRAAVEGERPLEEVVGTLVRLVEGGFLVEEGEDELVQIEAAHRTARTSRDKLSLVVAPSLACNLACPYCFERTKGGAPMRKATQDNVLQFVREYLENGTRSLAVTWYGGEPLLAFRVIRQLSENFVGLCNTHGCAYSADLVTNGVLLTADKARQLASWNVKWAQITLDGLPELHDKRRAAKKGGPTFEKILCAIEAAAAHMHVSVRINACREVAESLDELLQLLAERGINSKASVYVAPLRALPRAVARSAAAQQGLSASNGTTIDDEGLLLSDGEAAELEFDLGCLLRKYGFPTSPDLLPQPRNTACIADQDHSWLIEATGIVQKCDWTVGIGAEAVGHLTPAGVVFHPQHRKWREWSAFTLPKCKSCVMLPLCLTICPLRQMNGERSCLPFRHIWERALASRAGFPADQVKGLQLALAGSKIRQLSLRGVAELALRMEQKTCAASSSEMPGLSVRPLAQ